MLVVNMVQVPYTRRLRIMAVAVLMLPLVLSASMTVGSQTSDVCANRVGTIVVGTSDALVGTPGLHGVTYKDVDIPQQCFDGRLYLDPENSSPAIRFDAVCPGGFIRVWADAGTAMVPFRLVWLESGTGPCNGTGGVGDPTNGTSPLP